MSDDEELNADAIYAALVWLRDYAESEKGEADFRASMEHNEDKIEAFRSIAAEAGVTSRPIPKIDLTPELCEEIYPGEQTSVEFGLTLGRWLIFAPRFGNAFMPKEGSPEAEAVSRFRADRAN